MTCPNVRNTFDWSSKKSGNDLENSSFRGAGVSPASQQKRIALGRALLAQPRLLLLDEPFGSLDTPLRLALASELTRLLDQTQVTAILVTHDVSEALGFATRLAVLLDGSLAQVGPTRDVYCHPATLASARFLGDPPCSVLNARIVESEGCIDLVFEGQANHSPGEPLVVPLGVEGGDRLEPFASIPPGPWQVAIRPEYVGLFRDRPLASSPRTVGLPVRVQSILPRGPAALVELELEAGSLRAWIPPETRWGAGDEGFASFDLGRLLWYEPATGQLMHGGGLA